MSKALQVPEWLAEPRRRTRTQKTMKTKSAKALKREASAIVELPIEVPPAKPVWLVASGIVDRAPKHDRQNPVKVRVSALFCDGVRVMVLEGTTSEASLITLANDYNARGVTARAHRKAFADLPSEGSRAKASIKHQQTLVGEGFTPPPRQQANRAGGNDRLKASLQPDSHETTPIRRFETCAQISTTPRRQPARPHPQQPPPRRKAPRRRVKAAA